MVEAISGELGLYSSRLLQRTTKHCTARPRIRTAKAPLLVFVKIAGQGTPEGIVVFYNASIVILPLVKEGENTLLWGFGLGENICKSKRTEEAKLSGACGTMFFARD